MVDDYSVFSEEEIIDGDFINEYYLEINSFVVGYLEEEFEVNYIFLLLKF